jgi:hypothetical protein
MKMITGWVMTAGLVLGATAANAQVLAPYGAGRSHYTVVSDVGGPYAAMPEAVGPGYGPRLLPPTEVYTILRESGFSPLGIPQQRVFVYTISVIDRGGDDGRLVIDARTGRIIRFMPAYRMGDNLNGDLTYGPVGPGVEAGPLPPASYVRGPPRPPLAVLGPTPGPAPRVASRTPVVPMPKASPSHPSEPAPLAAKPAAEPAQRSAAVPQTKPADAQAAVPAAPAPVEAKPAPPPVQLQPTQEMPKAQGLD